MRQVRAKIVAIQRRGTEGPECQSGDAHVSRQGDAIDATTDGGAGLLVPPRLRSTPIARA